MISVLQKPEVVAGAREVKRKEKEVFTEPTGFIATLQGRH